MPRTLVLTNDFPPRQGGIETFIAALTDRLGPDLVVYTAAMPGDAEVDAGLDFPVIRDRSSMLLPTPRVRRAVVAALREHGCDRVLIGSSVPLGLLAPALRAAGARRIVAITHGHETWWARVPLTRPLLRRVGDAVDVLTYISTWTRDEIARGLSQAGRSRQQRLTPGVDPERFRPGSGGARVRADLGLGDDVPVVVCTARLVKRKGQDMLVRAWPRVLAAVPGARLVLVGDGPRRRALERLAGRLGVRESVVFTGGVPWERIPGYVDAADVFAGPSRTRLFGLEPEGLGIVYLEASACERPIVVGRSGGAPDTVVDGETGYLVDPRDPDDIARRLVDLLRDPGLRLAMGRRGRARVVEGWTWDQVAADCAGHLDPR
ncbi:glycosyltransferase [Pseudactinotalea sp. HY160]|uniref:glycosyltransferase family 4 protein n=1 Tax=Pseudactinotalea sp. HY160 TaxID=2654490 RepID=UPI00128D1736|nr:glycosyltransferase family 4 protein [Pseudactinotalea sp. HY160]MPV49942.1 glycosyltransferase [Pseudactinotalea sp. HY160]